MHNTMVLRRDAVAFAIEMEAAAQAHADAVTAIEAQRMIRTVLYVSTDAARRRQYPTFDREPPATIRTDDGVMLHKVLVMRPDVAHLNDDEMTNQRAA